MHAYRVVQHKADVTKLTDYKAAQLSQKNHAMLRVIKYFAKSLKIIQNGTIRKLV